MAYYVTDEHGQKVEAYTKEQVLSVLEQAIEEGSLEGITENSGFIEKIRCCVTGRTNKIAFVTQAQYNDLQTRGLLSANTYYYITDENVSLETVLQSISNIIDGTTQVGDAAHADNATNATKDENGNVISVAIGKVNEIYEPSKTLETPNTCWNNYQEGQLLDGGLYVFKIDFNDDTTYRQIRSLMFDFNGINDCESSAFCVAMNNGGSYKYGCLYAYNSAQGKAKIGVANCVPDIIGFPEYTIKYRQIGDTYPYRG